jgi:DNA-binding XRE family transcriptional regulator
MTGSIELGQRVREARLRRGWTQLELAEIVNASNKHISDIELGRTGPSASLVHRLDDALGTRGRLARVLRMSKVPEHSPMHQGIATTAHLFFPVVFATDEPGWSTAGQKPLDDVRRSSHGDHTLIIFPFMVAILHEVHAVAHPNFTSLAAWRRDQIERRGDAVESYIAGVDKSMRIASLDPYCLACLVVDDLPMTDDVSKDRAIEILSCPSVLLTDGYDDDELDGDRETQLLTSTERITDARSFGLSDSHFGWASWAGVALHLKNRSQQQLVSELVRLEVQLQAVWCYASHIVGTGRAPSEMHGEDFLRAMRRQLAAPNATEHTSRRLLREAIVETSRVRDIIGDALDALGK